MIIIISPAKKMKMEAEEPFSLTTPVFLEKAAELRKLLRKKDFETLKKLWQCNDKIAEQNQRRLKELELDENLTPALLAYEGLQYQYMAPQVFTEKQWAYVKEHLRILSGLYGILRPTDGVIPYRLEMQAKLENSEGKDLYAFWGSGIYEACVDEERAGKKPVILNLASKEYSRVIEPYQDNNTKLLTCVFGEQSGGKIKVKGTQAKMARGEMVRWLAENQIEETEKVKTFQCLHYVYSQEFSSEDTFVFLKTGKETEQFYDEK